MILPSFNSSLCIEYILLQKKGSFLQISQITQRIENIEYDAFNKQRFLASGLMILRNKDV
ncbi:hypothetical protein SAMN05421786_102569 [Chryseobacterium ureilyticum]|uniref:Uncharacterized protein n=1 Tax=Chryseobacterium ureilyticum TaxID=373668 RepID=A0A1N7MGM0_9FLAO|nr:hypothetical protein SAMN05421786_102569 [Chryseobacterium ureilyticum]